MTTVGSTVKSEPLLSGVQSILEFGSADGATYRTCQPAIYHGVDIEPQWMPLPTPHLHVDRCDVRQWGGQGHKFDLVICDAHGGVESPDTEEITAIQVRHAMRSIKPNGFIAVDDTWLVEIGRTALKILGQPTHIAVERPGFWIWRA